MSVFLIIVSLLVCFLGLGIFSQSKTVFHEIEAGILLIISAILFSGGFIVNEISSLRKDLKEQWRIHEDLTELRLRKNPDKRTEGEEK